MGAANSQSTPTKAAVSFSNRNGHDADKRTALCWLLQAEMKACIPDSARSPYLGPPLSAHSLAYRSLGGLEVVIATKCISSWLWYHARQQEPIHMLPSL